MKGVVHDVGKNVFFCVFLRMPGSSVSIWMIYALKRSWQFKFERGIGFEGDH